MNKAVIRRIEELHTEFLDWYAKYRRENPGIYPPVAGFNMPYSVAETWNTGNETLILTTNPKAQETKAAGEKVIRGVEYISESAWPENNELCNAKFKNQSKFAKAISQVAYGLGDTPDKASSGYAMWSVIPYRTKTADKIPDELWEIALYRIWGPIFGLWLPANIIVFGSYPFHLIKNAVNMHAFFINDRKEKHSTRSPEMRYARFKSPEGKIINVFGLPHPSRFVQFYSGERSLAFEFIAKMRISTDKNIQRELNL